MKLSIHDLVRKPVVLIALLLFGGAVATWLISLPRIKTGVADWLSCQTAAQETRADEPVGRDQEHSHAVHLEADSIALSARALKNVGFQPLKIELSTFVKSITVPAMVIERPGRSQTHITSPLTGVVTKIVPIQGAAIEAGSTMFEIRLTHEELVTAQSNLVRTSESLEVVNREIRRLTSLDEGVIAGKRILEQEYEKQKLEASLRAERQALLLHGLTEEQVASIVLERKLIQTITVSAPAHEHDEDGCRGDHLYHAQELLVKPGQQVEAGQLLCVLADHCELYVEGRAFEDDAIRLREAVRRGWDVSATLLAGDRATEEIDGLRLLHLADHVEPQSRAFRFYLRLPNQVALDQTDASGSRFLDWRFKPGQRMELHIPVEHWENRIVLPVEAVVDEGAEAYVYQQNGDHFDRVAVRVEYRDRRSIVIANDGAVYPGDIVAARGAYQIHLALKNSSGRGVDPHAGHNH